MEGTRNLFENLSSAIGEYLNLRTDNFKKRLIDGLSTGFSRALSIIAIMMLLLIVLSVFAFGFTILIGNAIGSWSGAAFIVGGVYLIGIIILIILRKRLFLNMFTKIFTELAEKETDEPSTDWKSTSLIFIRYLRSRLNND